MFHVVLCWMCGPREEQEQKQQKICAKHSSYFLSTVFNEGLWIRSLKKVDSRWRELHQKNRYQD